MEVQAFAWSIFKKCSVRNGYYFAMVLTLFNAWNRMVWFGNTGSNYHHKCNEIQHIALTCLTLLLTLWQAWWNHWLAPNATFLPPHHDDACIASEQLLHNYLSDGQIRRLRNCTKVVESQASTHYVLANCCEILQLWQSGIFLMTDLILFVWAVKSKCIPYWCCYSWWWTDGC